MSAAFVLCHTTKPSTDQPFTCHLFTLPALHCARRKTRKQQQAVTHRNQWELEEPITGAQCWFPARRDDFQNSYRIQDGQHFKMEKKPLKRSVGAT